MSLPSEKQYHTYADYLTWPDNKSIEVHLLEKEKYKKAGSWLAR